MPIRATFTRLLAMFRRRQLDADLDDEVRAHLELLAADYERRGMTNDEARHAARRQLGGAQQMKEAYWDRSGSGGSKTHSATSITRCARCDGGRSFARGRS